MLKIIIVLLFIGNIVALAMAFIAMMKDQGGPSKRTAWLLTLRVALASLLIVAVLIGLWTGEIGGQSPWG